MSDRHITIVIPAAHQSMMQDVCESLGETGMFTAGLWYLTQGHKTSVEGPIRPVGEKVAYISSGLIDADFVQLWLTGPGPVIDAAIAAGCAVTSPEFAAAWNEFYTDVSEDSSEVVQARLGVSTVDPEEEI